MYTASALLSGWLAELRAHGVEVEFLDAPQVVKPIPQLFGSLAAWRVTNELPYS